MSARLSQRRRRGLEIGPSDGGGDVSVVLHRERESKTPERGAPSPSRRGYAHVNRWRLAARGAKDDDTAARLIADALAREPGFRSYALVRTGPRDVVAVTIFESEAALRRAVAHVAPLVRRHVAPLAAAKPDRSEGTVLHYRAA